MRLLQALSDGAHGIDRHLRILLDNAAPDFVGPAHEHAFCRGHRRARIVVALQGLGKAEQITRMHHAHNDLGPFRRHLGDLEAAMQQQEEVRRLLALFEHGLTDRQAAHGRAQQ